MVDKSEAAGRRILSSRWIFSIKDNQRHKARLCVRGCEQHEGVDYTDIFAPVVNSSPMRIIFALAAHNKYALTTFDIRTAFLHGELTEKIFMQIPDGFDKIKGKICLLKRSFMA